MSWPKATVSLCYIWSQYCLPAMLGCGNHLWSIWFNVGWVVLVTGCPCHRMFVGGSLSINCWFHCSTSLISTQIQATGVAGNFWLFKENLQVTVSACERLLFVQIQIWIAHVHLGSLSTLFSLNHHFSHFPWLPLSCFLHSRQPWVKEAVRVPLPGHSQSLKPAPHQEVAPVSRFNLLNIQLDLPSPAFPNLSLVKWLRRVSRPGTTLWLTSVFPLFSRSLCGLGGAASATSGAPLNLDQTSLTSRATHHHGTKNLVSQMVLLFWSKI